MLNDIGADKLKLNFLQPSFGCNTAEDRFFAEHYNVIRICCTSSSSSATVNTSWP